MVVLTINLPAAGLFLSLALRIPGVRPSAPPPSPPAPLGVIDCQGAEIIDLASRRNAA